MNGLRQFFQRPWIYLVIVLIGIFLKFYKLNSKLFWDDEVATIMHTSGIKFKEYKKLVPLNEIRSKRFYDSLLHLNSQPYTIQNQVTGIFSDTHLTPLHYVFLTIWYRLIGDDDMNYRLFSITIFILTLPFLFLLVKNLLKSSLAGWIAISLYAVSPFINLFSQESRYYILWAFFFILCNWLFIVAINSKKKMWWIAYAITAIIALYTSILSGVFIAGHFLYVMFIQKQHKITFSVVLFFVVLAYLPWFYFLFTARDTISKGLAWQVIKEDKISYFAPLYFQSVGFVKSFYFITEFRMYNRLWRGTFTPDMYLPLLSDVLVFVLVIYAFYYLVKRTPKEVSWLLLLIILPLFLFLYIEDIVRNSFTSRMLRYQIINLVGIGIIVTNLLYNKIKNGNLLFAGFYLILIFLGITSIVTIAANRCWMTRGDCPSNIDNAQILSKAAHPIIITDFGSGISNYMAVLNECTSSNIDVLYAEKGITAVNDKIAGSSYSDVFVYQASDSLVHNLQIQFGENMVPYGKKKEDEPPMIWRINK